MMDEIMTRMEMDETAIKNLKAMVKRLQSELKDARNELCYKCGDYKNAHFGVCNDCRYRHGGEWGRDMHDLG